MVASNKTDSINLKNKKKIVGHLLSVAGWVLQKQMLRWNFAYRKLIGDPNLWTQGDGTQNGGREKMKCGVDLALPWSNSQGTVGCVQSLCKFSHGGPQWLRLLPPL